MRYLTSILITLLFNSNTGTKEINTEILIHAKPEKVWGILTDYENYGHWNPFIKSIKGKVEIGNKIMVRIEPPEASGMTFKPKVLSLEANKEISWLGHFLFPGLFDGNHKFELIDNGDGTTTFRQSEKFKGILVPLFKKMIDKNTVNGFHEMNEKLKERAEENSTTAAPMP